MRNNQMPAPTDLDLLRAAEALAATEQQHAAAAAAMAAAELERSKITDRIQALDAARAEIVTRRQAGDRRPDDGAALELHAADREGLLPILAERDAAVAAARSTTQHAKGQIEMARIAFSRLEAKRSGGGSVRARRAAGSVAG
jgi:hypothetical protein